MFCGGFVLEQGAGGGAGHYSLRLFFVLGKCAKNKENDVDVDVDTAPAVARDVRVCV